MNDNSKEKEFVYCSHCGYKNQLPVKFCSNCGKQLNFNPKIVDQSVKNVEDEKPFPISRPLIILIVIVFFALLLSGPKLIEVFTKDKITKRNIELHTQWNCNSTDVVITSCTLPANYSAETGFSKVSIAACNSPYGGGYWYENNPYSLHPTQITVGICKSGKCVEYYGKTGLVYLKNANNICPVGMWNN